MTVLYMYLYYILVYRLSFNLFKDQPEDGPTIVPKHVAGIII